MDGSIFFSLRYHVQHVLQNEACPLSFWFVVIAHELAHNRESGHNKRHEALMEALIVHFLPAVQPLFPAASRSPESEGAVLASASASSHVAERVAERGAGMLASGRCKQCMRKTCVCP